MNCPINETTADGVPVGRCWFHLKDGKTCPRHGDVTLAVEHFVKTGKLVNEKLFLIQQKHLLDGYEYAELD